MRIHQSIFNQRRPSVKVYQTITKGLGFVGMVAVLMMSFCTKDNPVQPKIDDTWTITGNVQDGFTGAFLDSAQVVYSDRDGKLKNIVTLSGGSFVCPDLPYGGVTITFKYTKAATKYTTTVLTIASGPKTSALGDTAKKEYKFRDTSVVVKLYGMSGTITGTVQTQKHSRAPLVIGAGVPVKVTYSSSSDVSMQFASPRTFTTVTGGDGAFRIDSLPLAPNAVLTLLTATVDGVDFSQKAIPIPDLIPLIKGIISLGTVVMDVPVAELDASSKFRLLYTNFPSKQILPNGTMMWTFSKKPDDVSYSVIQAVGASAALSNVTDTVIGNAFMVTPDPALNNGQQYFVSVFVYGAAGGFVKDTATVTVKSANTEQVIASNVLNSAKQGISGLGLNDSIYFQLAKNIKDVSVYVTHGTGANLVVDLVTVTTSNDKITIKPKGSWLAATSYVIYVSGTLENGTPVSFSVTVSTEGSLNFATSNAFDPTSPNTGKDGFVVSDTIIVTANKPLSAASAILTDASSNRIPVAVTVSDTKVMVDPQIVLNFGTAYTLTFTMTSTTGEIKRANPTFTTISSNFYMVNSNACIGGDASKPTTEFDASQAITIEMSDQVASATAALTTGGNPVATTTTVKADEPKRTIVVTPTIDKLSDNTTYSLTVTASSAADVRTTITINNFRTRSELYPVWSNVRMGNDPNRPVLNFDPLDNIIVTMSENLAKVTAQINSGNVLASITIKGNDTIVINPEQPLSAGSSYNVTISAEDVNGIKYFGTLVTGLIPVKGVFIVASNVLTGDFVSLTNVPIATVPWFKMSVAPMASSIRASVYGTSSQTVDNVATVRGDTLFVTPVSSFRYGENVTVSFAGMATNGKSINESATFTCLPAKTIRVVWSNVLNVNLEGLTDVSVTGNIKVLLSVSPKAGSITKTDVNIGGGMIGNAVIATSGDTIIIDPVSNMDYNQTYRFTLVGLDANNNTFSVTVPSSGAFKTSQNVFVVASNLLDANGSPIKTFTRFGAMWIKFSETLDLDKNVYVWANYDDASTWVANPLSDPADVEIVGEGAAAAPNAIVRINRDTLFVTPDNRAQIDFDKKVGFTVTIRTAAGKTATFAACVQTAPVNLFVKATNTKDANGVMRSDFGYRDVVWVIPSVQLDSIIGVTDLNGGSIARTPDDINGILRTRVRLAATGDTIFYAPSIALSAAATYGLDFTVHIANRPRGENNANVLAVQWKTAAGVEITSMNLLANATTYRSFKVIGDSIVASFSKAIDTSWNAPTPFAVNGFTTNYTTRWSTDFRTVTVKFTDTLNARAYNTDAADYSTDLANHTANYTITFDVTCSDGERSTGLAGGNSFVVPLAVKTESALVLIGSNTINGHATVTAINQVNDVSKDTFALAGNPTLVFNRALDTNRIKADAPSQYQNLIKLVVNGTATPLEFALSFSSDARTVTMNPVSDLIAGTTYDIILTDIPAIGLKDANRFQGPGTSSSILDAYDFKAIPATPIFITSLRDSIAPDTMAAALAFANNKYGYSPVAGGGVLADGNFAIRLQKTAWNSHYTDSVTDYEARIRNAGSGSWFILATAIGQGSDFDPFASDNLTARRWINQTINVAGEVAIYNSLASPDGDAAGANYTNGATMLNDSAVFELQVRPRKLNGAVYSYGAWSNAIRFADNVAPGDSDYTANVLLTPTLNVVTFDRTGVGADSSNYIDVSFPEDMDISTVPVIAFFDGASSGLSAPTAAATSRWTTARNYRFYFKLPGNNNYLFATSGWYFNVSVAGMKDYSGVVLQSTGTLPAPAAANGMTYALMGGTTAPVQGNLTVGAGTTKAGYYQFP
jgi:hypothetical protein